MEGCKLKKCIWIQSNEFQITSQNATTVGRRKDEWGVDGDDEGQWEREKQ